MEYRTVQISGAYIELIKLLKVSGVCATGGQAKLSVEDALVSVDGVIETRKRRKIKDGMTVQYGPHRLTVVCDAPADSQMEGF